MSKDLLKLREIVDQLYVMVDQKLNESIAAGFSKEYPNEFNDLLAKRTAMGAIQGLLTHPDWPEDILCEYCKASLMG